MGFPALREHRQFERFELVDRELPGQLCLAGSHESLTAVALDVSKGGLGILTGEALAAGTMLELNVDGKVISLRVMWNKARENLFRHRDQATDPSIDLEELFFSHGCIDLDFNEVLMTE